MFTWELKLKDKESGVVTGLTVHSPKRTLAEVMEQFPDKDVVEQSSNVPPPEPGPRDEVPAKSAPKAPPAKTVTPAPVIKPEPTKPE